MKRTTDDLFSIVILTLNGYEHTRNCIDSIAQTCEGIDVEIVVVDNGSTDETPGYLKQLQATGVGSIPAELIKVVFNAENRGFGGGCNQGMAIASGEAIVLLNNDTIVTTGWLHSMRQLADSDDQIGIVGPMSDNVVGYQAVEGAPAFSIDIAEYSERVRAIEQFAEQHRERHLGMNLEFPRIIGFCLYVKRQVMEKIGGFDLRFGIGNLEDDDYCLRAAVAGFRIMVCGEVFIHHVGSATFVGEDVDYRKTFSTSWNTFRKKWKVSASLVDESMGSYQPGPLIDQTQFDVRVHYSPLFSVPEQEIVVEYEARSLRIFVDPTDLKSALERWTADDDVTLVTVCDANDAKAIDDIGIVVSGHETSLPDLVVIPASTANPLPVMRTCTHIFTDDPVFVGVANWLGKELIQIKRPQHR